MQHFVLSCSTYTQRAKNNFAFSGGLKKKNEAKIALDEDKTKNLSFKIFIVNVENNN